jgi:hypothetical protein
MSLADASGFVEGTSTPILNSDAALGRSFSFGDALMSFAPEARRAVTALAGGVSRRWRIKNTTEPRKATL